MKKKEENEFIKVYVLAFSHDLFKGKCRFCWAIGLKVHDCKIRLNKIMERTEFKKFKFYLLNVVDHN
jgi:hypothetical protein